jgi:S1-C subfamily serine protease
MTASTRSRRALAALVAAVAIGGLVLAAVLGSSDDSAPRHPDAITPLRVTSGDEIATGFAVGRDRVVTVAHVLHGKLAVEGERARALRVDRRSDLALLAVSGISAPAPSEGAAHAGDRVHVLRLRSGRTSPLPARVRRAIVAHVRGPGSARPATRQALELAARVAPGDSGAPVLSRSGALAGVVFAASSRREGTAYAVDASALAHLLARR